MTVAVDLPSDLLQRLEERARALEPNDRAVSLLRAWEEEDATADPAEIEARRADWEETKRAMNEAHSSDRFFFP
jgi:hypothetical protein